MNFIRHKWYVLPLFLLIIIAGASSFYIFQQNTQGDGFFPQAKETLKVTRTSSGGVSGRSGNLTISGNQLMVGDKKHTLTSSQLTTLKQHITQADFFNLPPTYTGENCIDAIHTTIAITFKSQSNTVTLECMPRNIPKQLAELSRYLGELSELSS